MKQIFLVLAGAVLFGACENLKEEPGKVRSDKVVDAQYIINHPEEFSQPCMDSTMKDSKRVCTAEFKPVCGCNGLTYANPCKASIAGVLSYTEGKCPVAKQ